MYGLKPVPFKLIYYLNSWVYVRAEARTLQTNPLAGCLTDLTGRMTWHKT